MLDPRRDAPRAAAELRAVDPDGFAGGRVLVDYHQRAGDIATAFLGDVTQLFAVDGQHGLDVVEESVTFRLFIEPAFTPTLAVVIHLTLTGDVVFVQQVVLGRGQEPHRLGKGLDGVIGQGAGGGATEDLEVPPFNVVLHVL